MSYINLRFAGVSFSYGTSIEAVLRDVNVNFDNGWTGIIGPNGVGKTTLAKLAAGLLEPDSGTIIKSNDYLTGLYCEQTTELLPDHAEDFFMNDDNETGKLKSILGIQPEWMNGWNYLSHGERKRVQIAIMLWKNPDILVLDEPTNHLDAETTELISNALFSYEGIGLLISHNRQLLDKLCKECLFIKKDSFVLRPGGITVGLEQEKIEIKNKIRNYETAQEKFEKLNRSVSKHKEKLKSKKKLLSKKGLDKKDFSGKAKVDMARISGKDKPFAQKVKQMDGKLDKAKEKMDNTYFHERRTDGFMFTGEKAENNLLFSLEEGDIPVCTSFFITSPALIIKPDNRIGITGVNGAGKSLLIKYIYSSLRLSHDKLVYIPQELDSVEISNIMDEVKNLNRNDLGKLFTVIFRLGSEPERVMNTGSPSPGELRKIMLALGILKNPAMIIMDEPTNHMDLPSIECLEDALRDFKGALLLVSHDYTFLKKLTNIEWRIMKSKIERKIIIKY
jgi:macrolide transport system ATP-binding/permease protein